MCSSVLVEFCEQLRELLERDTMQEQVIAEGQKLLRKLVGQRDWIQTIMTRFVLDQEFLDTQRPVIDPNDITLFFSPDRLFSVRAFIWEPGVSYPIHDHGAWGMIGAFINPLGERRYKRVDDGTDPDRAQVEMIGQTILSPGETTFVLPLDDGIHEMWNPTDQEAISIHVYGKPVRKGYINHFDPKTNTAQRVYSPKNMTKTLVIKALGFINEPWAREVLNDALEKPNPEYIWQECRYALRHIK